MPNKWWLIKEREAIHCFLFHISRDSHPPLRSLFSLLNQTNHQGKQPTWVCLLNAKPQLQVTRGGSRLCANTKPDYLPIVHLKDGESRVLCQLLFLFFRRVRVLEENKTDRCVRVYCGQKRSCTSHARWHSRTQGFNNTQICSLNRRHVRQAIFRLFVNNLSV